MSFTRQSFERHPQARWLKHDAARWIRPDAARFYKPGTKLEDVFPALALKYSPNQPRVPAGSGDESGRWTDGDGGSSPSRPMGHVRIDDAASEIGNLLGTQSDRAQADNQRLAANDTPGGLPFNLADEEQNGGHAISEHVGKSERWLKDFTRTEAAATLARGDTFDGYSKGSFSSLQAADRLVNSTVSQNQSLIEQVRNGDRPFAILRSRFNSQTGYEAYLKSAYAEPIIRETYGVAVVILRDQRSGRGWRIQSAYPER